jgi:peptide deformylase
MAIRPIIEVKNNIIPSILTTKCEKVKLNDGVFDEKTKNIIKDLIDTARAQKEPAAAGLAAPQIGINTSICMVRRFINDPTDKGLETIKDYILINPKIITKSSDSDIGWESCLSIPKIYGMVQRYKKVKVRCLNEIGETINIKATGFFARVIQHEIDHLNGILFTTKLVGNTVTEEEFDKIVSGPSE